MRVRVFSVPQVSLSHRVLCTLSHTRIVKHFQFTHKSCFSLSDSFLWRDLLITVLWTNYPSCKTLKAAECPSKTVVQPQQVSLQREAISSVTSCQSRELSGYVVSGIIVLSIRTENFRENIFRIWKLSWSFYVKQNKRYHEPFWVNIVLSLWEEIWFCSSVVWCYHRENYKGTINFSCPYCTVPGPLLSQSIIQL